tara:strand:- start:108108 stop:108317 length:210 start_codon:yes stop_codon:yes gene_type:complete
MKKVIFSALALVLMVSVSSCRNTEEKTEEVTTIEETVETPMIEEAEETALETNVEVTDTTATIVNEVKQ